MLDFPDVASVFEEFSPGKDAVADLSHILRLTYDSRTTDTCA